MECLSVAECRVGWLLLESGAHIALRSTTIGYNLIIIMVMHINLDNWTLVRLILVLLLFK